MKAILPPINRHWPPGVGQKLYLFGKTKTLVVQAGREYRLLGTCMLDAAVDTAPAFAPGRIFIRAEESLYGIGKK